MFAPIKKPADGPGPTPNLRGYDEACAAFSWEAAEQKLDWLPGGALNIGYEAVDRHLATRGETIALRCLLRSGERRELRYRALAAETSRFADALARLGVKKGARVYALAGRIPELYVAALGTLKLGAVFCPMFSAFGPEPIFSRLSIGEGTVLITTPSLYTRKVAGLRERLPLLEHVLVVRTPGDALPGRFDLSKLRFIASVGELAIKQGWPSMFVTYLHEEARYRKCFAGDWYLSGDLARVDADGYYWFVGRSDDVIKSSGHLIGPFEVESALLEHPAVAEAGVIGKPDPVAGELVKAFVSLKPGFADSESLRKELLGHARKRLGAAVAPKELAVIASLPGPAAERSCAGC